MDLSIESLRVLALHELFWGAVVGAMLAAVITYLVNRNRQTASLAKVTLFLSILGLTTLVPLLLAIPVGHLAWRQIRRSNGILKGRLQAGFGLVCGYGLLLMAGYQLYLACGDVLDERKNLVSERANIAAIESAKQAWAAANSKKPGDLPTPDELAPFMPGGEFPPASAEGETYEMRPIGERSVVIRPRPTY